MNRAKAETYDAKNGRTRGRELSLTGARGIHTEGKKRGVWTKSIYNDFTFIQIFFLIFFKHLFKN